MNATAIEPAPKQVYLLLTLWALLLAKCFIFEYLVRVYQVPINSALYIWTLSISMATVASVVYLRLTQHEREPCSARSKNAMVWWIGTAVISLSLFASFIMQAITPAHLPAIFAATIGCGYAVQSILKKGTFSRFSTLGWWIGAATLTGLPAPLPLLGFAFCLIAFTAVPCFILYLQQRREIDHAMAVPSA